MELNNEYIKIKVDTMGAELRGIYNLETQKDMMWNGDASWWGGVSPVLFPFVGSSMHGKYRHEGIEYNIDQHGFLRRRNFEVASQSENSIFFTYTSTDEDYKLYPFKFELTIGYTIEWSKVAVSWNVKNLESKNMYYSIGGHPSFLASEGDIVTFETSNEPTHIYNLAGSKILDKKEATPESIVLSPENFKVGTWIYDGITSATLFDPKNAKGVKVTFPEFKYVAVWSPVVDGVMAPFVCIEPWVGLPDFLDYDGELKDREGIVALGFNQENAYSYTIEIA